MFKWLKRAFWTLLVFLAIASAAGFVYQQIANRRDEARFHPPGRMIDIGNGRRLNLDCRGSGSPTVILESGLGTPAILWADVLKGIEPLTRVCAYDRAGYGFSDPGPDPRTTNAIVDDLEKLLANSGERPPYILVGHSFGGFNIRVYAARYRADVAGLIFVDSSHPEQSQRMPASMKRKQTTLGWAIRLIPFMSRIGVVRAAFAWQHAPAELTYLESQPKYAHAILSELNSFEESGNQTKAESPSFGDLPVLVLTAGVDGTGDPAMADLWRNQLQPELVHLSTRGKQTIVEGSTHMIPTEKPQAVVDAVRDMLNTLKNP